MRRDGGVKGSSGVRERDWVSESGIGIVPGEFGALVVLCFLYRLFPLLLGCSLLCLQPLGKLPLSPLGGSCPCVEGKIHIPGFILLYCARQVILRGGAASSGVF